MLERTAEVRRAINLAHVAPFCIGDVEVHPATRQILRNGNCETLEPRVMQVLVALAESRSEVVTRDELIDLCWDGRIVGENAVHRVISRLRQIAAEFAGGGFEIETITKVGYRLQVHDRAIPPEPELDQPVPSGAPQQITAPKTGSRRAFLAGAAGVAVLAAGGGALWLSSGDQGAADGSAADLYQKGLAARSDGLVNMIGQAEDYFARAVEIDPSFADAWAALALARAGQVGFEQGDGQEQMAARARAAAQRALLLDPGSVEAKTALAFVPSPFGRWAQMQTECRRLLQSPGKTLHVEWLLRARLAHSLGEVGRCREALTEFRGAAAIYPMHSYSSAGLTQALWNAGYAQAAEAESDRAIVRFPRHPDVWFTRMALLTYGSRPERAVAFGNDRSKWPFREGGEGLIFRRLKTAEALAFLKPETIEEAVRLHRNSILGNRAEVPAAARFFVALGRFEEALDYLWSYYRNRGRYADPARPQPGPLTRYAVSDLFWPPMAPLWSDPRFAELTEEIGLAAYWRETGSRPDFRNPAPA